MSHRRPGARFRPARACLLSLALIASAHAAGAEEPATTFRYARPVTKNYLRATLEETAILFGGFLQYQSEQANSRDWDLNYDWPSFRSKLTGESVAFDTNHFDTNMLTHPLAGMLYYEAARGNRLDVAESGLFTIAASTFWEYVGEFREKVSVNDVIVTPVSGVAIGESFTQLGAFFDRGKKTALTETLSVLFGTSKSLHDKIDGNELARSSDVDDLGFTREGGHEFDFTAGIGSTSQSATPGAFLDANVGLRTHLVNVPEYARAQRSSRLLSDGNVSTISAELSFAKEGVTDLTLLSQVAPLGWYEQSLSGDSARALSGHRFFAGTTFGFDYAVHGYDHTRPDARDQISTVYLGGALVECDGLARGLEVRASLDAHPSFGAVASSALESYELRQGPVDVLPTVMRNEGYYFAWGATIAPRVELRYRGLRVGGEARVDGFWRIEGLDRYPEEVHGEATSIHDWRATGKAWIGFAPIDSLLFSVAFVERVRGGEIAQVSNRLEESSLRTNLTAVF